MAKSKSSASSATRKKHAKKGITPEEQDDAPPAGAAQRGQKKVKKSRFEPKVKVYTPPPPPPKGAVDPVDLYLGGGKDVDSELVVILRRLSKRDEATISKGVEGLDAWVADILKEELAGAEDSEDEWKLQSRRDEVVSSMAVWAHHFPRLALHPSRRLRLQTHALHTLLTSLPSAHRTSALIASTRTALLEPVWLEQKEYVGAWCCSAFDGDRAVRSSARRGWETVVRLPGSAEGEGIQLEEYAQLIMDFAQGLALPAVVIAPSDDTDDPSLLKTQALLAISYLLSTLVSPLPLTSDSLEFLVLPNLWDLSKPDEPASLRRAMYELLGSIVERQAEDILGTAEEGLATVSGRVLRYCWGEDQGWAGIIAFLRRYPTAWTLADEPLPVSAPGSTADDSDSEDGDDDAEAEEATPSPTPPQVESKSSFQPTPTIARFFEHLATGCSSHPASYPTILLLLSTIPSAILPASGDPLTLLFESFWSAYGGRALAVGMLGSGGGAGKTSMEEWAAALIECVMWGAAKSIRETGSDVVAKALLGEWLGKIWQAYLGVDGAGAAGKGVQTMQVVNELATSLIRLATSSESLFQAPWTIIRDSSLAAVVTPASTSLSPLSAALNGFVSSTSPFLQSETRVLAISCVQAVVTEVQQSTGGDVGALLAFIDSLRVVVGADESVTQLLDDLAISHTFTLLSSTRQNRTAALSFLTSQLCSTSSTAAGGIWSSLFVQGLKPEALRELIDIVATGSLPSTMGTAGIDEGVKGYAARVLHAETLDELELQIVELLVRTPDHFISTTTPGLIIDLVTARLVDLTRRSLSSDPPALSLLAPPIRILASYIRVSENVELVAASRSAALAAFEIAKLLPNSRLTEMVPSGTRQLADGIWTAVVAAQGQALGQEMMERLSSYLVNPSILASPIEIVNAAAALSSTLPSATTLSLAAILPPSSTFDQLLSSLRVVSPSPALSIIDPLVPQASTSDIPYEDTTADQSSLGAYARSVLAILEVASRDHTWAKRNIWILPHVLLVANVARDELAISGSTRGMFGKSVREDVLARLVSSADGMASYVLSSMATDLAPTWHTNAVTQLRSKVETGSMSSISDVLDSLGRRAREQGEVYARRAFTTVLRATLRYTEATLVDAERWLAFAQSLTEGSELARAIIYAIKDVLVESPRFVRYQNELASTISGIASSAASDRGLRLLRMLLATAPPLDAPVIFLPQQRTMFLIQRIQLWIGSDDDLDEEIHSGIAELFLHLSPIIQELSGSHWDLIFDILESNLETASWDEQSTLPALYHSCRLLELLKDLAASNLELRLAAKSRIDKSLELVRDLFITRPTSLHRNTPRVTILSIMAKLVRDIPAKLLVMDASFDRLLHLLKDPSLAVQQSAYDLVARIAEKHVTDLVVEVELNPEANEVIELPQELIALLSAKLPVDTLELPEQFSAASTYLLAWLTVFRFFDNASPRIKSAYLDQLRRLDLVAISFLPSVFALLGLSDRTRYFDVAPWSVDEFYLDLVDEISPVTLPVFATFVYYRSLQALPSLIRSWWESCKNRQLSMAVASFTSRHFSPVLIAHELAHLRDPDDPAGKALRDNDDFTVKVAAGANEVKAVFVVDEQNMEIGIRLPPDFPLQGVEIKDVRKVGVTDAQWRAWLLAVQQVITAQNGLIVDALSLFKRNVALHFEGVEACAICYSVISVVDRSLPTKGCRTCHNRFHAGCLYKWFSTSHGSSCPLCRSLF